MDVLFLQPAFPFEMPRFVHALAHVGARVWGVGDTAPGDLPAEARRHLWDYLRVPSLLDGPATVERAAAWVARRGVQRVETQWEPAVSAAAALREALGCPGPDLDTTRGFRDKPVMRGRVGAAGVPIPPTARVRSRGEAWEAAEHIGFPLVVKPVDGAGSADTFRVDRPEDLDEVLGKIGHLSEASLEVFIQGEESTYDCLMLNGAPVFESVSRYLPNLLEARRNTWISPVTLTWREPEAASPEGVALGRAALAALGAKTGFFHLEWFRKPDGTVWFGEVAGRAPGAGMVDLMNYANDCDLYRGWAEVVVHGRFSEAVGRRYHVGMVVKRAEGEGHIREVTGLEAFVSRHAPSVVLAHAPRPGAPKQDPSRSFLADAHLVVRHPDLPPLLRMIDEARDGVRVYAR